MPADFSHPRLLRLRPPIIALGLVALAWVTHALLDTTRILPYRLGVFGWVAIGLGVVLLAWPLVMFRRAGTTHDPVERPTALVTTGPYRVTRNPMYVGFTLVLLGIALLVGSLPFQLVPLLFVAIMDRFYIPREEQVVEAAIGRAYGQYRRRVRRWI